MNTYGKIMPDGKPAGANRNTPEQAMTPFEKWAENAYAETRDIGEGWNGPLLCKCWNAALAEAERLCREQVRRDTMIHGPVLCHAYCHQQDADAIAKLAEVDR